VIAQLIFLSSKKQFKIRETNGLIIAPTGKRKCNSLKIN